MLILTLRPGEKITIGPNVVVMLTHLSVGGRELRGGQAKLGFEAPPEVDIQRANRYQQRLGEEELDT